MKYATKEELEKHFGDGDPGDADHAACESCQFETQQLGLFNDHCEGHGGFETKTFAYCMVCATTFASNASRYPRQYPHHDVMAMVAHCTNTILTAIKEK